MIKDEEFNIPTYVAVCCYVLFIMKPCVADESLCNNEKGAKAQLSECFHSYKDNIDEDMMEQIPDF